MSIPIPVANTHTVTISGVAYKVVTCEECRREFSYKIWRTVSGEATSVFFLDEVGAKIRAQRQADSAMKKAVNRVQEVVPCPGCGWIQEEMYFLARSQFMRRKKMVAIILLGLNLVPVLMVVGAFIPPTKPAVLFGTVAEALLLAVTFSAFGIGLLVKRSRALRFYDPNEEAVEERLARGKERAFLIPPRQANPEIPMG